jgi:hypothetical protein
MFYAVFKEDLLHTGIGSCLRRVYFVHFGWINKSEQYKHSIHQKWSSMMKAEKCCPRPLWFTLDESSWMNRRQWTI